ncbi:hypothetical protein N7532_009426 [Penicillium argentinense]|uniref:Uncharacterized protein n=1 Tax=Penicillium argentinense TaxID=1131581 RepID=A0A9W9EZB9_9EURO|nr:uncharacterized protein N7532_009426 [Penicillium argentinense]KAJ5090742.1 hypothetical protein N7532_009426 [Penicillium argentinense]
MPESCWQQVRTYADHLGHRVVLEQYVSPDYEPEPEDIIPIQVYSLVPLDDDHRELRMYLMQTFWNDEVKPLFEIYSYCPPDGFACIEHNRIEIARRKQQHRSGVENPLPLIPRFTRPTDYSTVGFCVLLRSHSYRLGHVQNSDKLAELGEGPDLLYFNRSFSSTRSDVDAAQHSIEGGESLSSEAFELATERLTDQIYIGQVIILDIFNNVDDHPERHALDVDEGEPPSSDLPTEEQIRDQLGQETSVGGCSLDPTFQVSQDADIVTVTNTPEGKTSDIQYIVHAAFLSSIRDAAGPSLLESTAHLFTASMFSHLPANKTLTLKFFIPKSPSCKTKKRTEKILFPSAPCTKFPAGDDQPPTAKRISPQKPEKYIINSKGKSCDLFRMFTVVLDRAKFVSEAGVYFYMTDWSSQSRDPDPYSEVCSDDTEIVRGVDMNTVAGRLGVVVLEE